LTVIFRQHLASLTLIWSRTADIADSFDCSFFVSAEKGMHRRNILLIENGSLFTAVARLDSISMTWKLLDLHMVENISKISLLVNARGTLTFRDGS
jgi:hypothetical protein